MSKVERLIEDLKTLVENSDNHYLNVDNVGFGYVVVSDVTGDELFEFSFEDDFDTRSAKCDIYSSRYDENYIPRLEISDLKTKKEYIMDCPNWGNDVIDLWDELEKVENYDDALKIFLKFGAKEVV